MSNRMTSLGAKTLAAIIENDDRNMFRSFTKESFVAENGEQKAFDFIARHLRKHHRFPSLKTCFANGIELPHDADETTEYYAERLYHRSLFATINTHQAELSAIMEKGEMEKAVDILVKQLSAVRGLKNYNEYTSLALAGLQALQDYRLAHSTHGLQGVTTGWPTLDRQTFGLMPGDLLTLVSRPWMGKTYLLLKMAHAAWLAGHSVVFVTMEMLTPALVRRWIGIDAKINPKFIKQGRLNFWTERVMRQTVENYKTGAPVHFMAGNFKKNVGSIEAVVEQLRPDIVYVDAGYLLTPSMSRRNGSKSEDSSQVIKDLKTMATSGVGLPVGTSVQFNREQNTNGRVSTRLDLAKIGGTDAVGQDSDIVLGLKKPRAPYSETHRIVEAMKVRDGEPEDFTTRFNFYPMDFSEEMKLDLLSAAAEKAAKAESQTSYMI